MPPALLDVRDLSVALPGPDGRPVNVLDRISFTIGPGEVLGVVGESGCGKSLTAAAIMRLLPGSATIPGGRILWDGEDLLDFGPQQMRRLRGNEIAMIFQEPMTSLNPVLTIGEQIIEAVMLHQKLGRREATQKCIAALDRVGIPSARNRIRDYPHQLSGGMRQRVMIAMALSCNPRLLIADEPTTALDVTIQAQILDLLRQLQVEFGMAIMLITHDLGVIAEFAGRTNVMYAGRIIESTTAAELLARPEHPYTQGLIRSIPHIDAGQTRLETIAGTVPPPAEWPAGCRFHPRCPRAAPICAQVEPPRLTVGADHHVLCHRPWEERS